MGERPLDSDDTEALIITLGFLGVATHRVLMRYNLAQLLKEPTGSSREHQLDESFTGPERVAETASGPVSFIRTHRGILARATLQIRSRLACSRCLGDYGHSSNLDIEEEFFPTVNLQTGQSQQVPSEANENSHIDGNHVLDLADTIREYVATNMPMKPLCRRECLGLCQRCGADLNLGHCDCQDLPEDPRWLGLAELVKNGRGTE